MNCTLDSRCIRLGLRKGEKKYFHSMVYGALSPTPLQEKGLRYYGYLLSLTFTRKKASLEETNSKQSM